MFRYMSVARTALGALLVIGGYTLVPYALTSLDALYQFIIMLVLALVGGIIAGKKSFGGTVSLAIFLVLAIFVLDKYYLNALGVINNYHNTLNSLYSILPFPRMDIHEYLTSLPEFAIELITLIVDSYPLLAIAPVCGTIGGVIGEKISPPKGKEKETSDFFA